MNILYLKKEMLIHELVVRGVAVGDTRTVDQLRASLRPLLKLEKTGTFSYPPYSLKFQDEKVQIHSALNEAHEAIRTLSGQSAQNKFLSTQSRLVHLMNRTNRIPLSQLTLAEQQERADLLANILAALDSLETASRQDPELSQHFLEADVDPLLHPNVPHNSTAHPIFIHSAQPNSLANTHPPKPTHVDKWNLKFSGDNKKLTVHNFLERVSELKSARNITEKQLFDSSIDLFEGRALNWFRANKDRFNDWDSLAELLQRHFAPPDYRSRLFREILDRTQDTSESIVDYLSCMHALFRRYGGMSVDVQLEILCRNLSPFYSTQLPDVHTIEELEEECLKLETKKYRVESYVPPSRKRQQFVEPDFAFLAVPEPPPCSTDSLSDRMYVNEISPHNDSSRISVKCWNCQKNGHLNRNCPEPRKIHCYRCGTPDVTVRTCNKCSGNEPRRNR